MKIDIALAKQCRERAAKARESSLTEIKLRGALLSIAQDYESVATMLDAIVRTKQSLPYQPN